MSEYPSSTRDFSFLIDDLQKVNEVSTMLMKVQMKLIKDSFIFDFYKNDKTKIVKLGYRCIFQSNSKHYQTQKLMQKFKKF